MASRDYDRARFARHQHEFRFAFALALLLALVVIVGVGLRARAMMMCTTQALSGSPAACGAAPAETAPQGKGHQIFFSSVGDAAER